jgi:adenylate cyclase
MSRVEVLAQTVQSLRSPLWHPLTELGASAVIAGMGLLGGMSALLALSTQLLTLALIGLSWLGLAWYQQLSPTVAPVLSLGLGALFAGLYRFWTVELGRAHLRRLLSRYVAEPVARELLRHPDALRLGGQRRHLTVLFSAIDGFTPLSEKLPPEAVMQVLNEYFARMVAIIDAHQGTLRQFVGDEIMVMFNAPAEQPDHPLRAVRVAVAMERAMQQWMAERADGGLAVFSVKLGIHSGEAVLGNVGTASRAEYAAVGEVFDTGTRLTGLAKALGVPIVISEVTAKSVEGEYELREHAQHQVYEVVGLPRRR